MAFGLKNTKPRVPKGKGLVSSDAMGITGVPAVPFSQTAEGLESRARGDLSDIHRAAEVMGDSERMGHVKKLVSKHAAINSAILGGGGARPIGKEAAPPRPKVSGVKAKVRGPKVMAPRSLRGGRI